MGNAGRPKAPQDRERKPGISIRLTDAELDTIQRAVNESGMKTSVWARKALLYVAIRGIRMT